MRDGFSRYAAAYPLPNKEAVTKARVLLQKHIPLHRLPQQIHSDNELEFVNNLWKELMSELKLLHTLTPPYNPSSNAVERFHRTLVEILRTQGPENHRATSETPFMHNTGEKQSYP